MRLLETKKSRGSSQARVEDVGYDVTPNPYRKPQTLNPCWVTLKGVGVVDLETDKLLSGVEGRL
jgi:hypothetical protein